MKTLEQFPVLFQKTSTGATQEWNLSVCDDEGTPCMRVEYGQQDGAKQILIKHVHEGKNLGKKNETTPLRQAMLEAKALWLKKKDKGYVESLAEVGFSPKLPMLAHPYGDRKHNIKFPAYAQPKLDGVRCFATKVADDQMVYTSRNGKYFKTLEGLTPFYLKILNIGETADGEVYNPRISFQQLVSAVKRQTEGIALYHYAYDFPTAGGGFLARYEELERRHALLRGIPKPLQLVPTVQVDSHEEFLAKHQKFTEAGFEGSILRNADGEYVYDHRSVNLLKHKDFIDAEYEIVDVVEARLGGKDGACVFICQCPRTGKEFGVAPEGDFETKNGYLLNKDKCIGKLLTVRFQKLSDDGIPIFPIGVAIRGYE